MSSRRFLLPVRALCLLAGLLLVGCPDPVVPDTDITPPSEVEDLSIVADAHEAVITWTDPADDDFDHVIIAWSPDGTDLRTIAAGVQRFTATGLATGTAYAFLVCTADSEGNVSSGSLRVAIPGDEVPPGSVTGLAASPFAHRVILTWSDPDDPDLDHVEITWAESAGLWKVAPGDEIFVTTGMKIYTEYTINVRTVDTSDNHADTISAVVSTVQVEHEVAQSLDIGRAVDTGDIDGDGDEDIVRRSDTLGVEWWENPSGAATAWSSHIIASDYPSLPADICVADLDGDLDPDVIGGSITYDTVVWWENTSGDGSAWTEHTIRTSFGGPWGVYAARIDSDADLDVLAVAADSGLVSWFENTSGDGSVWTEHVVDTVGWEPRTIYSADMNGDGSLDILVGDGSGDVAWWDNTAGDGTAWTEYNLSIGTGIVNENVRAADVDDDGDLDIVAVAGSLGWWENTAGDGSAWTEHVIDASLSNAPVAIIDIDDDDDWDVAYGDQNTFEWWENTAGDGSAWTGHDLGTYSWPYGIALGDFNGDGFADLAVTAGSGDLDWWEF